ncbi:hypothetical protein [Brevibacillus formosus]|uniref:hypothetical protein n=1 Tax=Brevibacillus formosus TaxID=54913 RepID=UPI003F1A66FC
MENKLVLWAGNAEGKESLVKSIKEHLSVEYAIKDRELIETDKGIRFLFDDETGSDIVLTFSQHHDSLSVTVSGNCSWDVIRLHEEILAMLPDEEGVA